MTLVFIAVTVAGLAAVRTVRAQETRTPETIVDSFIQTETRLREALKQHTFKRDVVLQTIGRKGQVTGEYVRNSEFVFDDRGNYRARWVDSKTILGVPHDIPIAGYGTKTANLLRLWASKATEDFDLAAFNSGGYVEAVREKAVGETVSKVLYPNDKSEAGNW